MNDNIKDLVIDRYDSEVRLYGSESVKSSEIKAAIKADVIDMIGATERNLDREADLILQEVIGGERQRRSRSLKKNLEYLLDGFSEDGAYMDPLLDLAFPLGDEHGTDKTLRHWTPDDFNAVVTTRYRVAADVTGAAKDFDEMVQRILERMHASGAQTLGDATWEPK